MIYWARFYDLGTTLLSFGQLAALHRRIVALAGIRPGERAVSPRSRHPRRGLTGPHTPPHELGDAFNRVAPDGRVADPGVSPREVTYRSLPEPLELIPSDQLMDADDVAGGSLSTMADAPERGPWADPHSIPGKNLSLAGTCDAWS
jgi:hypothetical protein